MTKTEILARIKAERVVALIRADGPDSLLECARALCAGGRTCSELTMTTPGAIELCARVTRELPEVLLGLGTVLDVETVHRGLAAGAKFIVTPVVKPDVIMACRYLTRLPAETRFVVEVPPALARLVASLVGAERVVIRGAALPAAAFTTYPACTPGGSSW